MPEVVQVFYGINRTKLIVEKYELRRGNDLLRVSADGEDNHFRLKQTRSPVAFLFRTLIDVAGAHPTETEKLAKIRSDLEAKAQRLRTEN